MWSHEKHPRPWTTKDGDISYNERKSTEVRVHVDLVGKCEWKDSGLPFLLINRVSGVVNQPESFLKLKPHLVVGQTLESVTSFLGRNHMNSIQKLKVLKDIFAAKACQIFLLAQNW